MSRAFYINCRRGKCPNLLMILFLLTDSPRAPAFLVTVYWLERCMAVVSFPSLTYIFILLVARDLASQRGCLHFLPVQHLVHRMDTSSNRWWYETTLGTARTPLVDNTCKLWNPGTCTHRIWRPGGPFPRRAGGRAALPQLPPWRPRHRRSGACRHRQPKVEFSSLVTVE